MAASKDEDGPYDVLHKLRHAIGIRYNEYGSMVATTELAELVMCMYCNSIWIGLGLAGLWLVSPKLALLVASPLALSGGALLLENK